MFRGFRLWGLGDNLVATWTRTYEHIQNLSQHTRIYHKYLNIPEYTTIYLPSMPCPRASSSPSWPCSSPSSPIKRDDGGLVRDRWRRWWW